MCLFKVYLPWIIQEKYYHYNILITLLKQIISGKLLQVIISE